MASICSKSIFQPKPKRPLFGSQDTVTVRVGAVERCFTIHRDLLRQSSPYFKSALDGGFKESHENIVMLREDNPDAFELFVRWLYLQHLDLQNQNVEDLVSPQTLVQLYVFAEMRGVLSLKDIVISLIIERYDHPFAVTESQLLREIPYVYENTSENSQLRKLLVDLVVSDIFMVKTLTETKECLTMEFLLDVAGRLKELAGDRAYPGVEQLRSCEYHEHPNTEQYKVRK